MAISGLNKQEAITLLQRQGLSTAQQAQVLSSAGLLQTTQMLNASMIEEAVLNSEISGEKAEQVLTELGLIEAKTGNLIVTKECTVAEVAQALATKGIVGADAEAILSQLGLATANTTTTVSFAGLTTAIKANTIAMAKWLVTNPVGWCILAVGAIYGLTKAYDALTVSEEEMAEAHEESIQKAKDSVSEYEELKQELETIQQTYDDNEQKLKDLYKLRENQTITKAEQDYLEELEGQNEKLRQQIEYKQTLADIEAQEAEDDAVKALNEKTQDDLLTGRSTNGGATVEFDKITDAEKIKQNTATINALTADLTAYEKVIKGINLSQEEVDKYTQQLVGYQEQLNAIEGESDSANFQREFYQGKIDEIQKLLNGTLTYEEYEKAVSDATNSTQSLVKENNTLLEKVEPLNDAIKSTSGKNYELKKSNDEIIANAKDAAIGFSNYTDSLNNTSNALSEVQKSSDETDILSFSDAWEKLKNSTDDATKGLADNLTELAEKGQLTVEALSKADTTDFFKNAGISVEEAVKKINELVSASTQLQSMSTQISKMSDMLADKKNGTVASASDLAGFDATVKGLESWAEFERVMGSSKSSMEECQKAADALATEWVNNGNFLANLTEENKQYYVTQLDNMGVENADAVVTEVLGEKKVALSLKEQALAITKGEVTSKSADEVNALLNEANASDTTREYLFQLVSAEQAFNNTSLDVSGKIAKLGELASAYGQTAIAAKIAAANAGNEAGHTQGSWSAADLKHFQDEIASSINTPIKIKPSGSGNYKPSGSSGGSRGGSKTKETKQAIDWIERKITILNNKIDAFATKASDTWSSWTSRTKALNSEMETTKKLLTSVYGISSKTQKKLNSQRDSAKNKLDKYVKKNSKVLTSSTIKKINSGKLDTSKLSKKDKKVIEEYKKLQKDYNKKASKAKKASEKNPAADYYFAKANKVAKKYKLSPAIIKKIKNGTINISDYNESMANAIQKYQDYYDKGKDAQKSKKEAKQKLNELAQQNFELIQSKWDARIGYQENRKNAVSDALNLAQSKGKLIGTAYYTKQKGINNKEINKYKQEETELKKAMKGVKKYSKQWYEYKADLSEVHSKYVQLQADNAELQNSINELKFDRFDELINKFDDIIDESDFLIDLLDSDNLFNSDNGSITNDGITAMGLTAQNYDVYLAKAEQYKKQIADLEQMYKNGEIGISDYNSKMRELQGGYRDSIKSANDAKKAVIDYVKQGLDAQNEALSKSIDKQKELLESEKDLKSFQDTILDQNKNIANLRKQIAALEGDSSEETRKRIQQLKSDLQDAEKEQADTLYDRSVSDQEKALDDMLTKSQDAAEAYLKDSEKVFIDALNYVNANTSQVSQNLEKIAKDTGYDISTYITNAWKDSGDAVGTYESTLSSNVPKITAQIQLITNAWQAQCEAAEKAAKASAKAAAGTDETTKDTDKKGNSSNGSGNKSKTSSAKDIKKYITDHADKAKQKKSYYGVLNQYIYDKTGGKVLSVKEEVELAKMLGVSVKSDLSGSGDRKKIYDALLKKKIAFANGGILGDLVKLTGEDGLFIGSAGESILTKEQTQALIDFRPAIPQFGNMMDILKNVSVNSRVQSPTYQID